MAPVRAHTADLAPAALLEIRALLDAAFEGDFAEEDWEHALGGVHVLLREGRDLVGHAAVVQRRLLVGGSALRTGYVEAVAVRRERRDRGLGGALMAVAEDVVRSAYELGALSSGGRAARLYERRGWLRWEGPTWALSPDGPQRTADDDVGVFVLPTPTTPVLDLAGPIACDWRPGDVW
ncbi:MAG: GNAT family N-acetyltransferase [Gaiellaceae bacterium]